MQGARRAVAVAFVWALPSLASAQDYAFDLPKKNPKAMHAFQKIVPARFRTAAWVYKFDGTASPMETVTYEGRAFVVGHVCKPHDCGDNQLAFLIAEDGSAAFGLLRSAELTNSKDVPFGHPDAGASKLLAAQIP